MNLYKEVSRDLPKKEQVLSWGACQMGRSAFFVLILISTLQACSSHYIHPHNGNYVIYSPIDGHVFFVTEEGKKLEGGGSEITHGQLAFDNLRDKSGLPRRYSTIGSTSSGDGLLVSHIISDILEIKHQQEKEKYNIAMTKKEHAESLFKFEKSIATDTKNISESEAKYIKYRYEQFYKRIECRSRARRHTCLSNTKRRDQRDHGYRAADTKHEVFKSRQNYQLDTNIPTKLEIAQRELNEASRAIELVEATMKLGYISCPKKCTVNKVFIDEGQYVNKGDPVVQIRF